MIAIIDLDQTAGNQAAADEQDGDQKVIAHQALAATRPGFAQGEEVAKFFLPVGHNNAATLSLLRLGCRFYSRSSLIYASVNSPAGSTGNRYIIHGTFFACCASTDTQSAKSITHSASKLFSFIVFL